MFLDNSRYAKTPSDEVTDARGRPVTALRLRRLPAPPATSVTVEQGDRPDLLAARHLRDGTAFWRIADANTKFQARDLTARVLDAVRIPRA
jgi:hypothetical protein